MVALTATSDRSPFDEGGKGEAGLAGLLLVGGADVVVGGAALGGGGARAAPGHVVGAADVSGEPVVGPVVGPAALGEGRLPS